MTAVLLAAASYSRIGFSICISVRARRVRVSGGSVFHLESGTIMKLATPFKLFRDAKPDSKTWF